MTQDDENDVEDSVEGEEEGSSEESMDSEEGMLQIILLNNLLSSRAT